MILDLRRTCVILLGCILAAVSAQRADSRSFASDRYAIPGVAYGMADKKLNFYCIGSGKPAVIIHAGLGDWSPSWTTIHDAEMSRGSLHIVVPRAHHMIVVDRARGTVGSRVTLLSFDETI